MSTLNISLPNTLEDYVNGQVSESLRDDHERMQLRGLLLAGAATSPTKPTDSTYFDELRDRVRKAAKAGAFKGESPRCRPVTD